MGNHQERQQIKKVSYFLTGPESMRRSAGRPVSVQLQYPARIMRARCTTALFGDPSHGPTSLQLGTVGPPDRDNISSDGDYRAHLR